MKSLLFIITFVSLAAFAEHDAIYCGKMLDSRLGQERFSNQPPQALLAVDSRIRNGVSIPWEKAYAAVNGLDNFDIQQIQNAVRSSQLRGTMFCVKARWGGAAYSSKDLRNITLNTDAVIRIDYMSAFLR